MSLLASEFDEWANLYPCLSLLAGIALAIPVSSVNCEHDFSTMNRVRASLLKVQQIFMHFLYISAVCGIFFFALSSGENRPLKPASRRTPGCLLEDLHKWTPP